MTQATMAGIQQPSLAGVLAEIVGPWGAVLISIAVLISVLGAYLAWSLICAEVLFAAAKSNDMPKMFAAQNANEVPANALWMTNIVVSLFIISTYFSQDAFNFMLDMTSVTSLLPYLLVAGYGVLIAQRGEGYEETPKERIRDQIFAWIAVLYTLVMFVAAGLKYLLLLAVLLIPGTILYVWARREQNARLFTGVELVIFGIALVAALVGVWGLITGTITP
jgi:arginine:ornithine antiporter/lysine permease